MSDIALYPDTLRLQPGSGGQLLYVTCFSWIYGNPTDCPSLQLSLSDTTVATARDSMVAGRTDAWVTGRALGQAVLTATAQGIRGPLSASALVFVQPP